MRQDKQGPMTLAINDSQMDLHVISFTGREALNQPYRFDIDLVSRHSDLDCASLTGRSACLTVGPQQRWFHGEISEARQLHAGEGLSLYRVSLMPALARLARTPRSRTFNGMSVPMIIRRLLQDHGLESPAYRFERIVGVYPPRELCVQYQETDLHLLQRLCEEEGISFRFEHDVDGHALVFADDPACFPELLQSRAMATVNPHETDRIGITHLAEHLTLRPSYSSHACEHLALMAEFRGASVGQAATQAPFQPDASLPWATPVSESARQRQVSARTLERLRCERRVIRGRSNQPALVSGQIMRVTEHPERLMNDQWLLTEVRHAGRQLSALKSGSAEDIAAVVQASTSNSDPRWPSPLIPPSTTGNEPTSACCYHNEFAVIPWAMPFRPPIRHPKPAIHGLHTALLSRPQKPDVLGRVALRFQWQPSDVDQGGHDTWAAVCSAVEIHPDTTAVSVGFFDDDPDQPVICGALPLTVERMKEDLRGRGVPEDEQNQVQLQPQQHLTLGGSQPLTLRTTHGEIEITARRITVACLNDA